MYIKKYWHILVGVVCVVILGIVYFPTGNSSGTPERIPMTSGGGSSSVTYTPAADTSNPSPTPAIEPIQQPVQRDIMIHIEGAVYQPGVFTLPYGSRVNDALTLAGGPTEEADLARINLAAFLQDAVQIIIPTIGEDLAVTMPSMENHYNSTNVTTESGLININTADERLLTTLPGIGPAIADNIISHREANGPFNSVEELRNVPRIGAVTMDRLRDLVTIN